MSNKIVMGALRAAQTLLRDEVECLTESYWNGGSFARRAGKGEVSPEGKHYLKPYQSALKKIGAAIETLTPAEEHEK